MLKKYLHDSTHQSGNARNILLVVVPHDLLHDVRNVTVVVGIIRRRHRCLLCCVRGVARIFLVEYGQQSACYQRDRWVIKWPREVNCDD